MMYLHVRVIQSHSLKTVFVVAKPRFGPPTDSSSPLAVFILFVWGVVSCVW